MTASGSLLGTRDYTVALLGERDFMAVLLGERDFTVALVGTLPAEFQGIPGGQWDFSKARNSAHIMTAGF